MSFQRGFAPIFFFLIILVLASITGVGYYYAAKNQKPASPTTIQTPLPTSTPTSSPDKTTNWKTYTNQKYGITFKYPGSADLQDNSASDLQQSEGGELILRLFDNKLDFNRNFQDSSQPYQLAADNENYFTLQIGSIGSDSGYQCGNINTSNSITIDGVKAFYNESNAFQGGGKGYSKTICVNINGLSYQFFTEYFTNSPVQSQQAVLQLFNQVLSTVQFTNQTTDAEGKKVCQSDADCSSDESCVLAGPIAIDPVTKKTLNQKTCWPKGAAIPL